MVIEQLSILNYKNIEQAELTFSPKINCFVGANGMGKTNVLDALYYLSFCRSHTNPVDAQVVRHGAEFLMLQGKYLTDEGEPEVISCGLKPGRRKRFKRGDKEYRRLAEHIGVVPLVLISPADTELITGGSEERRRFMDVVISQYNLAYLDALIHYGRALQQRNQLLKAEAEPDPAMLDVYEEIMAGAAEVIFAERARFVEALVPLFSRIYARIAGEGESVGLTYESHCARGPLIGQLRDGRAKERIVGYTLHGTHKDDLTMELGGYPVKREGSQGQCKTYLVALKAGAVPVPETDGPATDAAAPARRRVRQTGQPPRRRDCPLGRDADYGQIFLTDTNREHLDRILEQSGCDHALFRVDEGRISHEAE